MTVPALTIRDAEARDMAAVQAIYAHHVLRGLATFEEVPPDAATLAERWGAVRALGLPWLVAVKEDAVLGYAYAAPYRERAAYRHTIEDSVYVAEDRRGEGIGRALIAALLARVEAGPWRQMLAVIGDRDNAGSIALHARAGFAPAGLLRAAGFKHGRWVDVVLMQRALGPGDGAPP